MLRWKAKPQKMCLMLGKKCNKYLKVVYSFTYTKKPEPTPTEIWLTGYFLGDGKMIVVLFFFYKKR